jgi:N-acetylmuramoyl-L-alanine amidase
MKIFTAIFGKIIGFLKKFRNGNTVSKSKKIKEPKKIYKIGLSPGHGGGDTGAVSPTGQTEADVARKFCRALDTHFSANRAFDVKVFGFVEEQKNYRKRVAASNARGDDYYIPIHLNAFTSPTKNGWLIFVDTNDVKKSPQLKDLCVTILNNLQATYNIGWGDWDSSRDGYMEGLGRAVYEETAPKADTVYLELGYLSNPQWDELLKDHSHVDAISKVIVESFEQFLGVEVFHA